MDAAWADAGPCSLKCCAYALGQLQTFFRRTADDGIRRGRISMSRKCIYHKLLATVARGGFQSPVGSVWTAAVCYMLASAPLCFRPSVSNRGEERILCWSKDPLWSPLARGTKTQSPSDRSFRTQAARRISCWQKNSKCRMSCLRMARSSARVNRGLASIVFTAHCLHGTERYVRSF